MRRHYASPIAALPLMVLLMLAWLLYGCATAAPPPVVTVKVMCPPIVSYTPAHQKALAAALRALSQDNPLSGAMADYHKLRDALRACSAS